MTINQIELNKRATTLIVNKNGFVFNVNGAFKVTILEDERSKQVNIEDYKANVIISICDLSKVDYNKYNNYLTIQ